MKTTVKEFIFNHRFFYKLFLRFKNRNSLFYRKKNMYAIKDIIVCGMQRSGSTLLFNIIIEILKEKDNDVDTFFDEEIKYKNLLANERSSIVKKNHTYLTLVANRIKEGKSIGFFTHRDIRDVIVSSIQKGWLNNIDEWISNLRIKYMINNSILYAKTPNMHIFSYEQLMNSKIEVILEVAKILEVPLTEDAIERIENNTSIKRTKKKLQSIPEGVKLEFADQLHKNHIADGQSGKWRMHLSKEEANRLTDYCSEYLHYFGYQD